MRGDLEILAVILHSFFIALFASSIILNYRIAKFLNLSLGSMYTLGAYVAYLLSKDVITAIIVSGLVGFTAGIVLCYLIKFLSKNTIEATIVSLGFGISIEEILRVSLQTSYFLVVELEETFLNIFGEKISILQLTQAGISFLFFILLFALFKSSYGLKLKFIEEDLELAELYGVDTDKYIFSVITVTSFLISVSGCLLSTTQALSPLMGFPILICGIIVAALAVIFGGIGAKLHINSILVSVTYSLLAGMVL
ncbi:hypothetical protein B6U96_10230 [Archaeoglobales archaeon ex4484_92]|nr:MAG: hypothetical protein B6U96_10230 [Archaeoglobales archaeon ex4484_92]